MAISDNKKVDLLWKKVGYGVTKTDDAIRKSASNESISSPLLIRGDRIWIESDQIPNVIPLTSSEIVEVRSSFLGNVVECQQDSTSTPLRTWKTNLTDWIPAEFGPTYQVKVYVDNPGSTDPTGIGTRLYPDGTGTDEWYFDYQSGVLHFIGDSLPSAVVSGKSIFITGARNVGATGLAGLDTSGNTTPAVQGTLPASQTFLYNGVTLSYTLTETPSSPDAIDVYVNDVLQRPGEASLVNGNILTLTGAPPGGIGDEIYVKYRYPYATVIDLPNNSIENRHLNLTYTSDQYSGTGTQVVFDINPGHTVHDVLVIVNGLVLSPNDYQVNGTVLTLNSPPLLSATIDIRYLPV